jgi:hypothetical protein
VENGRQSKPSQETVGKRLLGHAVFPKYLEAHRLALRYVANEIAENRGRSGSILYVTTGNVLWKAYKFETMPPN